MNSITSKICRETHHNEHIFWMFSEVIDSPSREETVMEGYGDVPGEFNPFPFTKTLPKSDENETAFSDKLKLMGKSINQLEWETFLKILYMF